MDATMRHLRASYLKTGWGRVHGVQEVDLLAHKDHRGDLDAAVLDLVDIVTQRCSSLAPVKEQDFISVAGATGMVGSLQGSSSSLVSKSTPPSGASRWRLHGM